MKQCPKCQVNISDTAKFCMECGCNIKKYEEEQAKPKARFCPECGTEIPRGSFCPECGYNIGNEQSNEVVSPMTDTFDDAWLSDIENSTNADIEDKKAKQSMMEIEQDFSAFEYEAHTDGTYTITGLKDKTSLQYSVPQGVVSIAAHAFEGCNAIKVTLPEGIMQIGEGAFKRCIYLDSINLPKSLVIIGDEAFAECEMLDIIIPTFVRKVGKDATLNTVNDKKIQAKEAAKAALEAKKVREAELAKWKVGNSFTFGSYYRDDSSTKKPIEWIISSRKGNSALLISKYGIDCKVYNDQWVNSTWESCQLRRWLNNEFFRNAFNFEEQGKIQSTGVHTPNSSDYHTAGGNDTSDKVFLLSLDEFKDYVGFYNWKCSPTAYAISNGADRDKNGCSWWWLRSPGHNQTHVVCIDHIGVQDYYGKGVTLMGGCVRPALWITLDI